MVMKITEEQYAKQRFGIEDRYARNVTGIDYN